MRTHHILAIIATLTLTLAACGGNGGQSTESIVAGLAEQGICTNPVVGATEQALDIPTPSSIHECTTANGVTVEVSQYNNDAQIAEIIEVIAPMLASLGDDVANYDAVRVSDGLVITAEQPGADASTTNSVISEVAESLDAEVVSLSWYLS